MKNDFEPYKYGFFTKRIIPFVFILSIFGGFLIPNTAHAGFFDMFSRVAKADTLAEPTPASQSNSQKMVLAQSNMGPDNSNTPSNLLDILITDTTLTPKVGPLGSNLDVADIPEGGGQIGVYTVHSGDTISSVAQMFGVTKATIISANDLTAGSSLKQGDILAIPPVSGRIHNVKQGDTVTSLAKKYKVDAVDIAVYNDLDIDSDLTIGDTLIIPDSSFNETKTVTPTEKPVKKTVKTKNNTNENTIKTAQEQNAGPITAHPMRVNLKVDLGDALLRPVSIDVSRRSQGAHDIYGSAVDLAAPLGTPIMASANGTVVLAREVGWNGGYGNYVIIMSNIDGNIVQTIYAHMSKVLTTVGAQVHRGEVIGLVGKTGRATGYHVHFEVHGALNPLTIDPNYTGE